MTSRKHKVAAVDAALSGMFGKLEARGVPEHLRNVVDQLHAAAQADEAAAVAAEPVDEEVRPSPGPPSSPEP